MRRGLIAGLGAMLACLLATGPATAQGGGAAAPHGQEVPIRLLVGFPPGGGIDLLSRVMAEALQARLARTVVVENRTGAGGNLAADAVARAAPDGSVLGAIPAGPLVINRHVYRQMPFDPLTAFTPIGRFAAIPVVILGAPGFAPRDIAGLREALRAAAAAGQPANCGTPGAGTTQHLTLAMLMQALGTTCTIVHYRGTGPALPDLLTGTLQVYVDTVVTGLPPAREGRARALAIASPRRVGLAPDVPVVAETVPGFEAETWLALLAPRGLPEAEAARLEAALADAARDPRIAARLRELGAEPDGSGRAALAARIPAEDAKWGRVIRESGITLE
ncbi:tripartite tricarboxylate transporter substrate-binding protein [Roseomonas sp. NAR14]|uniref:Tripartite tricarboxylate transporter substrate-binding protein n=1 Tax=Roseomonas acroporae TaxID=2937791 RepID=A0A9X2BXI1_9PROT|nr:tripartite tricarboxylate transporter substrate-binding protein [Roseomonas acroporae]MCK8787286.1 tripartite tricarboxylate transporter substrate-binding protein [Roseomonas acroporae]